MPRAAVAQSLSVQSFSCDDWIPAEVLAERLSLELRSDGVDAAVVPGSVHLADVALRAPCDSPGVRVEVRDPRDGRTYARRLDLTGMRSSLRLRWIALSAAELLRARWSRTVPEPRPSSPADRPPLLAHALGAPARAETRHVRPTEALSAPAAPRVSASLETAATEEEDQDGRDDSNVQWGAGVGLRSFPDAGLLLGGGSLAATVSFGELARLAVRTGAFGTSIDADFDARLWMTSVGGTLLGVVRLGDLSAGFGVDLEGGLAFAEERRAQDNFTSLQGVHGFFLAALAAELAMPLSAELEVVARGAVGWTFAGFAVERGAGGTLRVDGAHLSSSLGVRLRP